MIISFVESACDGQTHTIDLSYSQSGSISSPGYPNNYGNRKNCQWLIIAPYGDRFLLYFLLHLIWKIIPSAFSTVKPFLTDKAVTVLFGQKVVEVVFLHQSILQADTSTCNSPLTGLSRVKGLWLTIEHSTDHQVGFVNYVK